MSTTIRTGQPLIPTLTQRDTTATTGVAQPTQTTTAAGAARVATTVQDGFEAAPVALAAAQAKPFREVLPHHASMETKAGEPMGDAGLERVLNHLEQTFGRRFTPEERAAWKNEAREMSKQGGDENAVWGRAFTKLNSAGKNTPAGQNVLPTAAAQETKAGEPMGDAGLERVLNHVEQTFGRKLNQTERAAWKEEALKLSKEGGDENAVWGKLFTKLNSANKNTPAGQNVLPTAAAQETKAGEAMGDAGLERVLNHLEQTIGRQLTPNERSAWKNEAREMSKQGGDENAVWGKLFTKFNSAFKNVNND